MKRVFVVGTRGIPGALGGVETHCEELFPRLAALGWDVTVVRRPGYARDGLEEWRGVKLVDVSAPRGTGVEAFVHTFLAITRAHRMGAGLVHIHAIGPALWAPYARLLGMKVVLTHHGPDYDRAKWGRGAKQVLRLGERLGCRFADDVIVISDVIRGEIARRYGRTERVHLIYNGVPRAERCDFPEYFEALGIRAGAYVLGMCRFVPEKNLHHLIEACAGIDMGDCRLVLAGDGDGDYSRALKERAREAGVVLTGFVKGRELQSLLTHARCYCLPSSHEGLPIALLEAMSYGLPVVVSDIAANREVGLGEECYFPVGDVAALRGRLQALVREPLRRVDYDLSKYDWDVIAGQVAQVYAGL